MIWLLSQHTERAAAELGRVLRAGNVVLLQEAHWTPATATQWGGLFKATQVAHAVARVGPRGGPQGGVAVVVPHPHRVLGNRVLAPGCALEVMVAARGTERRVAFVSVYLPPDSRRKILANLHAMPRPDALEVYPGGGVNLQLHAPRDDDQHENAELVQSIVAAWGACPGGTGRATRRGRSTHAALDFLAAPGGEAWSWDVGAAWRSGLTSPTMRSVRLGGQRSQG